MASSTTTHRVKQTESQIIHQKKEDMIRNKDNDDDKVGNGSEEEEEEEEEEEDEQSDDHSKQGKDEEIDNDDAEIEEAEPIQAEKVQVSADQRQLHSKTYSDLLKMCETLEDGSKQDPAELVLKHMEWTHPETKEVTKFEYTDENPSRVSDKDDLESYASLVHMPPPSIDDIQRARHELQLPYVNIDDWPRKNLEKMAFLAKLVQGQDKFNLAETVMDLFDTPDHRPRHTINLLDQFPDLVSDPKSVAMALRILAYIAEKSGGVEYKYHPKRRSWVADVSDECETRCNLLFLVRLYPRLARACFDHIVKSFMVSNAGPHTPSGIWHREFTKVWEPKLAAIKDWRVKTDDNRATLYAFVAALTYEKMMRIRALHRTRARSHERANLKEEWEKEMGLDDDKSDEEFSQEQKKTHLAYAPEKEKATEQQADASTNRTIADSKCTRTEPTLSAGSGTGHKETTTTTTTSAHAQDTTITSAHAQDTESIFQASERQAQMRERLQRTSQDAFVVFIEPRSFHHITHALPALLNEKCWESLFEQAQGFVHLLHLSFGDFPQVVHMHTIAADALAVTAFRLLKECWLTCSPTCTHSWLTCKKSHERVQHVDPVQYRRRLLCALLVMLVNRVDRPWTHAPVFLFDNESIPPVKCNKLPDLDEDDDETSVTYQQFTLNSQQTASHKFLVDTEWREANRHLILVAGWTPDLVPRRVSEPYPQILRHVMHTMTVYDVIALGEHMNRHVWHGLVQHAYHDTKIKSNLEAVVASFRAKTAIRLVEWHQKTVSLVPVLMDVLNHVRETGLLILDYCAPGAALAEYDGLFSSSNH